MPKILAISGSLREGSLNTAVLKTALELAPEGWEIVHGDISEIPLYNGDVEDASGVPAPVTALNKTLAEAQGLLLVSPEYNSTMPGVLKNTLDWMSRSNDEAAPAFKGKPVALAGATPGGFGTVFMQDNFLPMIRALGMRPWLENRMAISRATDLIENGKLTDEDTRKRLANFLSGYAAFCAEQND